MRHRRTLFLLLVIVPLVASCTTTNTSKTASTRGESLVIIEVGEKGDATSVAPWAKIYDHYFEIDKGKPRQRLLATVATADLARVREVATVQVVDEIRAGSHYYWFHGRGARQSVGEQKGQVVYQRSSDVVLVRLPYQLSTLNWPKGIEVVAIDWVAIPPVRISTLHFETTFQRHMMPLPDHVSEIAQVREILDGFDFGSCMGLQKNLTGEEPIENADGTPRTVATRQLCGDDIDPLLDWLDRELTADGLAVTFHRMAYSDAGCPNRVHRQLVATIPGTDLANQLFLVTAHVDAVPGTVGADDNASGVTAMLCAAKALAGHRFRRTIQFVAFNAEEVGIRGSVEYVRDLILSGTGEICGAFNMDMIAWDADLDRKFQVQSNPGDGSSEFMRDKLVETVGVYGINLVPVAICDPDDTSDQRGFWQQGKPAVLAGEEFFCEGQIGPCNWEAFCQREDFNPNWHLPSDTVTNLSIMEETTKAIIGVTAYAAEIQ